MNENNQTNLEINQTVGSNVTLKPQGMGKLVLNEDPIVFEEEETTTPEVPTPTKVEEQTLPKEQTGNITF